MFHCPEDRFQTVVAAGESVWSRQWTHRNHLIRGAGVLLFQHAGEQIGWFETPWRGLFCPLSHSSTADIRTRGNISGVRSKSGTGNLGRPCRVAGIFDFQFLVFDWERRPVRARAIALHRPGGAVGHRRKSRRCSKGRIRGKAHWNQVDSSSHILTKAKQQASLFQVSQLFRKLRFVVYGCPI